MRTLEKNDTVFNITCNSAQDKIFKDNIDGS